MNAETATLLINHESKIRNQVPASIRFRKLPVNGNSQRNIDDSDTVLYVLNASPSLVIHSGMGFWDSFMPIEQAHQHETPLSLFNTDASVAWVEAIFVQWE